MINHHQAKALDILAALFESEKYSDFIVACGEQEFKVHRNIICSHSKFFTTICDADFQEKQTGRVALDGDDVDTVWRMLSYLYTQDYSDDETVCEDNAGVSRASGTRDVEPVATEDPPSSAGEAPQAAVLVQDNPAPAEPCADADDIVNKLQNNAAVYAVAEKYGISQLKELAKSKFEDDVDHGCLGDGFLDVVRLVYKSTPSNDRGMRDIITRVCSERSDRFLQNPGFITLMLDEAQLSIDVLRKVNEEKNAARLAVFEERQRSQLQENALRIEVLEERQRSKIQEIALKQEVLEERQRSKIQEAALKEETALLARKLKLKF